MTVAGFELGSAHKNLVSVKVVLSAEVLLIVSCVNEPYRTNLKGAFKVYSVHNKKGLNNFFLLTCFKLREKFNSW